MIKINRKKNLLAISTCLKQNKIVSFHGLNRSIVYIKIVNKPICLYTIIQIMCHYFFKYSIHMYNNRFSCVLIQQHKQKQIIMH